MIAHLLAGALIAASAQPAAATPTAAPATSAAASSAPMPGFGNRPELVAVSVTDADRSARWYAQTLGFTEQRRMNLPDYGLLIVFMERDGFRIEIIQDAKAVPPARVVPDHRPMAGRLHGITKVAFETDDVDALTAALAARGVTPIFGPANDTAMNLRHIIVTDPDGNLIQFLQRLG